MVEGWMERYIWRWVICFDGVLFCCMVGKEQLGVCVWVGVEYIGLVGIVFQVLCDFKDV